METSDSECFESADEELYPSNDEKSNEIASLSQKCETAAAAAIKIEKLNIRSVEAQADNTIKQLPPVKTTECSDSVITSSNITSRVTGAKSDKKDRQPKPKLGTKIKKSDLNLPTSDVKEVAKAEVKSQGIQSEDGFKSDEQGHVKITQPKKSCDRNQPLQKEENMWEDDNWEPVTSVNTETVDKNINSVQSYESCSTISDSSWSGWGKWDMSSLLSTATMGVTTITNQVSQGITTVLETGMGIPEPEEMARLNKEGKEKIMEGEQSEDRNSTTANLTFGLGNFVSGVSHITKLVETTGNKVISGGLDTLESIGKKTMEVLQEGDPGLKKKRAFLKIESDKPVLSQILREAKEKAEHENTLLNEKHFSKKANYETLFDDHQGLVHLEALEMLSKQCDIKLQTLLDSYSGDALIEMQETMGQIRELCELNEEEEDETLSIPEIKEKLDVAVSEMNIPISYDKLISTWVEAERWLDSLNLSVCSEMELHEQAIDTLAQLTAIAVEQFHKSGELLLIKEHRSTVDEADSLVQLTTVLTLLISSVAAKLSDKLNEKSSTSKSKEKTSELITNIYYEAANSSSYIKNAFQLLIPVLQVGAI